MNKQFIAKSCGKYYMGQGCRTRRTCRGSGNWLERQDHRAWPRTEGERRDRSGRAIPNGGTRPAPLRQEGAGGMALGAAEAGWRRPDTLAAPVKPARAVHRRREPRKTGLSRQEERAGKGQGSRDGPGRQPLQGS